MLERKFASTGSQTHNHQVMSLTHSPLSRLGGAHKCCTFFLNLYHTNQSFDDLEREDFKNIHRKGKKG